MTTSKRQASAASAPPPADDQVRQPAPASRGVVESLHQVFEDLGLALYEARIMVALLRLGPVTGGQLARVANVPRTSTYQVLEELRLKDLVDRLPGPGTTVWTCPGQAEVINRLVAVQEGRLRHQRERAAWARETMAREFPTDAGRSLPYARFLHDPSQARHAYEQGLADATHEVLVCNRPPYSWSIGEPNPAILATLRRGVKIRVLYQRTNVDDEADESWHREVEAYHAAGVEGRVSDELPIKLAVFDHRAALLTLSDPVLPNVGYPTALFVDHPGFSAAQAAYFEYFWQTAAPYASARRRQI